MKGEKFLQNYYTNQLQKQMDEDYVEFMKEEQRRDYPQKSVQKITPAYEQSDVFQDLSYQKILRAQKRQLEERQQRQDTIRPDGTKVRTVHPNEQ